MSRKHVRGDGTTYERAGQWYASVPAPPGPDGRRRRVTHRATPNTEQGAEQTRRRLLREVALQPPPPERHRLGDWLAAWLARRTHLRPNSLAIEKQAIARLRPLHAVWMDDLTPARLQAWVDAEAGQYAPRTVAMRLAVLRAALTLAVDLELLHRNPAAKVRPPRQVTVERPILTAAQARRLLELVEDTPYAAVFGVGVCLGLRMGEALGLTWADVDLSGGWLHVRRQSQRDWSEPGARDVAAPLKTPAARRSVPLPSPLVGLLTRHRLRQATLYGEGVALLSVGRAGRPMSPGSVWKAWVTRLRDAIGAPAHMTYHDLRHTATSLLADAGVPQATLQAWMGHASGTMTAHYSHADEASLARAAGTLAFLLASEPAATSDIARPGGQSGTE